MVLGLWLHVRLRSLYSSCTDSSVKSRLLFVYYDSSVVRHTNSVSSTQNFRIQWVSLSPSNSLYCAFSVEMLFVSMKTEIMLPLTYFADYLFSRCVSLFQGSLIRLVSEPELPLRIRRLTKLLSVWFVTKSRLSLESLPVRFQSTPIIVFVLTLGLGFNLVIWPRRGIRVRRRRYRHLLEWWGSIRFDVSW